MDYIIFGLGLGATLTLVGWAFREWGAALRDRSSSSRQTVLSGYELVNRMAWQRFCRSCGAVLAIFGLLVLLATIIATVLMLSNATGATIVLVTVAVCTIATLVWLGLFLHRFGSRGILRPQSAKPSPELPVSRVESDTLRSPAEETPVIVGPPLPPEGASMAAGPLERANITVPEEDMANDDAEPVNDGQTLIEAETEDLVEHVAGDDQPGSKVQPDDRSRSPVEVVANDEPEDDPANDDEPMQEGVSDAVPGPEPSTRRVVMLTAKDDEEETLSRQEDTDFDDAQSLDAGTGMQIIDDSPDQEGGSPSDAGSPAAPEGDPESVSEADIPLSSGRAEAVRKLRQRRIKRLTRDPSAPD